MDRVRARTASIKRTRRSASRTEEDAPPVGVDRNERARAQARQPSGVPPAGEDVGPGAMVEQLVEGVFRYEMVARAETAALREHVVAGERPGVVAQEHDGPAEVEGQRLAEGLEADHLSAGLDVGRELARRTRLGPGAERPEEDEAQTRREERAGDERAHRAPTERRRRAPAEEEEPRRPEQL